MEGIEQIEALHAQRAQGGAGMDEESYLIAVCQLNLLQRIADALERSPTSSGEVESLQRDLVEANQMLRSCYSVTERRGADTNWAAFDKQLSRVLEKQRQQINEFQGYSRFLTPNQESR